MKAPFTSAEVQAAIKQLLNNKSAGRDNIKAEQINYGAENIAKEAATIYNEITRTGKRPNEINQGVRTTIQRPDKAKGPTKNTFHFILKALSVLKNSNFCFDFLVM